MKNRKRKLGLILIAAVLLIAAAYQIIRGLYIEEDRQTRIRLRETLKEKYPDEAEALRARYGIKPANGKGHQEAAHSEPRNVILVHGLDEPGRIWMNLAPELMDGGFNVWFMWYPNDQPVSESAGLFREEMLLFRKNGNEAVSIVAFSMGGLVAREMLTNPELGYSQSVLDKSVPKVEQLIMIGTPNHGSALARFRIFAEFRDQLANLFTGDYIWLRGVLDGAGEAGLDLIPGSRFLEELNSRPHPNGVQMAVIAGMMSTTETGNIDQIIEDLKNRLPDSTHDSIAQMEDILNSVAHRMGDGVVPVDSARLDGVPLHIVPGMHYSIIRNITEGSRRLPPSIPIVMDYLNGDLQHDL